MDRRAQGALLMAIGGVSIRLGLTGAALSYIKASYVPLLMVAGACAAVLGGLTLWDALREPATEDHDGHDHAGEDHAAHADAEPGGLVAHGHDHSEGPRIAWFLAVPLFAILLIAPPPLGSFAANRQGGIVVAPTSVWPELPPAEAGAVPLDLGDFASRALYDTDLSLAGETVRLVGFSSGVIEEGFVLTRFSLSCCAADGQAINIHALTDQAPPAVDQWVEVVGRWRNRDGHIIGEPTAEPPLLEVTSITPVPQPEQPYEG